MAVCCFSFQDEGCINPCDPLTLGTAPADGVYTLEISFEDEVRIYKKHFLFFEPLEFDIPLNENAFYKAKVSIPAGSYQCYKFITSGPSYTQTLPDSIPTPP
jgi:hypothetical protein